MAAVCCRLLSNTSTLGAAFLSVALLSLHILVEHFSCMPAKIKKTEGHSWDVEPSQQKAWKAALQLKLCALQHVQALCVLLPLLL